MRTKSPSFRIASFMALLAVSSLPFWNAGVRTACAAGPAQSVSNVLIPADAERVRQDIDGYLISTPTPMKLRIDVQSETRAATIEVDAAPSQGVGTLIVTVADTAETLVLQNDGTSGTVMVNGRLIASWNHLGDDEWEYTNFNRLGNFTSWNTLMDSMSDSNLGETLPATVMGIGGIVAIVVAVFALIISVVALVGDTGMDVQTVENWCATHAATCEANNWDPTHPSCVYFFTECPQLGFYQNWCAALDEACYYGDEEACDLLGLHCVP